MGIDIVSEARCFGGVQGIYRHDSRATGTPMRVAVFTPPQAERGPVPVLYWLSGLTCTEENFVQKAGAQRLAAEHGFLLVAPDTSPRGLDLPGEHESWDFGSGAGFYVDATREPWSRHYRMYEYVTQELPEWLAGAFPVARGRAGIFGHSMGGHGALVIALRNPDRYRSVSAFAPISSPMTCPWGEKAFRGYLGDDRDAWRSYDACALARERGREWRSPILVDQGTADQFLAVQLQPERLAAACAEAGVELHLRMRAGYDHSYFFVASFIAEHFAHHAALLGT
jgi:S-formylglutathione hydrolase